MQEGTLQNGNHGIGYVKGKPMTVAKHLGAYYNNLILSFHIPIVIHMGIFKELFTGNTTYYLARG